MSPPEPARPTRPAGASDALFVPEGPHLVPTDLARGPWSPDALHGGPVAALLAGAVEAVPADDTMQVARLTVELLRPVPVAALTLTRRVTRPGRKVQVVEATLSAAGTGGTGGAGPDVAWCRALRVRRQPPGAVPPPAAAVPGAAPPAGPPGPEHGYGSPSPIGPYRAFHNTGAELRYVAGAFAEPGPATVWVRLAVPVVAGQATTALQRVAAAADFGNGVSAVLDFGRYLFINPDLTVSLLRLPVGEWVCLDACTTLGDPGVALAESRLFDVEGPIGRSVQSLLVEPRP